MTTAALRLTQYAHGGGCACKIPPGELEEIVAGLTRPEPPAGAGVGTLLVGLDDGDDAAVVLTGAGALVCTADFFTPVVDDPYDWGRIAAANALSDVYAMGGRPVVAVNLLGWPRDVLPFELAREVLRGGLDVASAAGCHVAGGHSVDDPEPKYGMAVTGLADPERLLRNDAGRAGVPLTLTKPLGVGVLNNRHKSTGEVFPQAVELMTTLNADAARAALAAGADVRHRRHRLRPARPPAQAGPRQWGDRRARRGGGAVPRRCPRVARRGLRQRRDQAQPRLGTSARRPRRGETRTRRCCSPTPRPPVGCWWRARCPVTPSSADSFPAGATTPSSYVEAGPRRSPAVADHGAVRLRPVRVRPVAGATPGYAATPPSRRVDETSRRPARRRSCPTPGSPPTPAPGSGH